MADTAPVLYRLERGGPAELVRVCDPVFELVETGELACLVSSVTVAEIFVGAYRLDEAAIAVTNAYLSQPSLGVVPPSREIAQSAGWLVARRKLGRLADALIAATANDVGLPLLTSDRGLARSGAANALLVTDYA